MLPRFCLVVRVKSGTLDSLADRRHCGGVQLFILSWLISILPIFLDSLML